ncbi:MAG: hypothetical protein CL666_00830 [Balneola sp.]|nr:hypothetical protein [Balneola sp.]|tara:strand:+ start:14390 stop:15343 length:954 start_codon:yes stop_codon:yes gene_type:complete
MREVAFLRKNADKWKEFEQMLDNSSSDDPDKLADLYVELSADLAYAQANYPGSKTEEYLNQLSVAVHSEIYRSRKEERGRLITFWTEELPLLFASKQKELLYSFLVFMLAIGIGILSSVNDPSFVRQIMGDAYVNMTISNIDEGDPLAVYKKAEELDMFFAITINNVRVSFYAFASGLLTSIGTGVVLLNNGIMVGAFLNFFAEYNLIGEALRVIFIHGALELSAIVIAGAAGFVVGNGILFPGTYTRRRSFIRAGKEGLKMIIGLVPVFVAAGLLESFVTRYTQMPLWLSLCIIFGSFAFIIYYFIWLPLTLKKNS